MAVPDYLRSTNDLRGDLARLEAENAQLRRTVETTDLDRNRLAELEGLTRTARSTGYALVPASMVTVCENDCRAPSAMTWAGTRA